jgi:ribosomal protein S18 acetylase RimI-like enzyme
MQDLAPLTLRKAVTDDSEFAYTTKRAAFRRYVEQAWGGWDEAEQRRLHEQRFRVLRFRVVNVAGADVGILATTTEPDCLTVHQIFLLPEHQGRETGRRCMDIVFGEARALGVPVRLRVLKVNTRAFAFYRRLGFKRTGETDSHDLLEYRIPARA